MNIITIRPLEHREREYFAYYRDDFLKSVYSVAFTDTIVGALALQRFFEMIKLYSKEQRVDFDLCDKSIRFKSQAVKDALTGTLQEVT